MFGKVFCGAVCAKEIEAKTIRAANAVVKRKKNLFTLVTLRVGKSRKLCTVTLQAKVNPKSFF
jgi:hypothetical protein